MPELIKHAPFCYNQNVSVIYYLSLQFELMF